MQQATQSCLLMPGNLSARGIILLGKLHNLSEEGKDGMR